MSNVKISAKGKALLQRHDYSSKIVLAIVSEGDRLYDKEGLTVMFDNYSITLRSARKFASIIKK